MGREDDGIKDIEKELNKLARKKVRAAMSAVSAGAQIYAAGLEKNTPRGRSDQDPHKTHENTKKCPYYKDYSKCPEIQG